MHGGGDRSRNEQNSHNNYDNNRRPTTVGFQRRIGHHAWFGTSFGLQSIFRYQSVFIEAQKASHRAYKSTIENAAGQLFPVFVLQRNQEARSNACGGGNFFQSDTAHFPLAF